MYPVNTLFHVIHETADGGEFYATTNIDSLPVIKCSDNFKSLRESKASCPNVKWQEPDEDCDGDIVAYALEK